MLPSIGRTTKFKYQSRSKIYFKIICGLVTLASIAALIQLVHPISAINTKYSATSLPESAEVNQFIAHDTATNLNPPDSRATNQDAYTELFDIGDSSESLNGRYFRIRRDSASTRPKPAKAEVKQSTTELTEPTSPAKTDQQQPNQPDLVVSPSLISRDDGDSSQLYTANHDGSYKTLDRPKLATPSLAELTALGTAAGLLAEDLVAKSNELALKKAEVPRQVDIDSESQETDGLDRQDASKGSIGGEPSSQQFLTDLKDSSAASNEPAGLDQMPDSIESLMNSEIGSDDDRSDASEVALQQADLNPLNDPTSEESQSDEPDDGQVTQSSQNHQNLYPISNSGLSQEDLALLQANGYNQANVAPLNQAGLAVPTRDSYTDLNSAAGHHYGYKKKKKKKIKKKKIKKKKKVIVKKKKIKKYKVKVVKYKKKKKKVKKVKKVKKHKKHKKHHHHHDHGKYYM